MRTATLIGILVGLLGCSDGATSITSDVTSADAGMDATSDACVMAQGNCGCVWYDSYDSATGVTTSKVVCP